MEHIMSSTNLCVIGKAIEDLESPYRDALVQMVETPWVDGGLSDLELEGVMRGAGLRSSQTSVSRHRRRLCVCATKG